MKKLLFILSIVLLASCNNEFSKVDETTLVPAGYSDSTKWEDAKIYKTENRLFIVTKSETVQANVKDGGEFIFCLVVGLLLGFLIGGSIFSRS